MLPAPKNKAPVAPAPERVLGGGRGPGLVFKTAPSGPDRTTTVEEAEDEEVTGPNGTLDSTHGPILEERYEGKPSLSFMPTSVARGKANISLEEKHAPPVSRPPASSAPGVDFFSLGSTTSSSSRLSSTLPSVSPAPPVSTKPVLHVPSAAPKVEDFVPPEPTPTDPYPGYYLLPSGQWAAYDPVYYKKFYDQWKRDYDAHVRALEKGKIKGFEDADDAEEVNALKEMEKAKKEIQEREERKALTTASAEVPDAPKMNIKSSDETSTINPAFGGVSEPRSTRGEDCNGQAESKGGWEQIWLLNVAVPCQRRCGDVRRVHSGLCRTSCTRSGQSTRFAIRALMSHRCRICTT
ncbi:hypothetical protein BD413DRAFT_14560 [Trametes elegans]|nr:hypothetical protein BD413DRAFT_14560 [Trametes elegans]